MTAGALTGTRRAMFETPLRASQRLKPPMTEQGADMTDQALSTLPREAKGRIAPPPA